MSTSNSDFSFARDLALRALGPRAKSRSEILELLKKKNVDSEIAASVCDDLEIHGFLNDLDFAHQWVESRIRQKKSSKLIIANELKTKGIDPQFISEALSHISEEQQLELAFQIASKKYRQISHLATQEIKEKIGALLARKGYPYSATAKVMEKLLEKQLEN